MNYHWLLGERSWISQTWYVPGHACISGELTEMPRIRGSGVGQQHKLPEKFEGKPYSRVLTLGAGSLPICFMKRFCPLRSRGFVGPLAWTCTLL